MTTNFQVFIKTLCLGCPQWLDEHQFLECLIQIICGTYVPEVFPSPQDAIPEGVEKAERETPEKPEANHTEEGDSGGVNADGEKGKTVNVRLLKKQSPVT